MENEPAGIEELLEQSTENPTILNALVKVDDFLTSLKEKSLITSDNQFIVDGALVYYVFGQTTKEQVLNQIEEQLLIEDEFLFDKKLLEEVEIFTNSLNLTSEKTKDDSEEGAAQIEEVTPQAVSPLQALASVQQKLKQSSAIAPASRDYSIGRTTPETPQAFDPYREIPQGK